jgi:hypothetical protein
MFCLELCPDLERVSVRCSAGFAEVQEKDTIGGANKLSIF